MKKLFQKFMNLKFVQKIMNVWYENGSWLYVIIFIYLVLITLNIVEFLLESNVR